MAIFEKTLKLLVNFLLPFFILINMYSVYLASGGADFIGGYDSTLWNNSFFGISSLTRVIEDLGAFDFKLLFKQFTDLVIDATGNFQNTYYMFAYWNSQDGITQTFASILAFFVQLGNLFVAPVLVLFDLANLLITITQYIMLVIQTIINAFAGYYNTPLNSYNNGWAFVSDYVYTM